MKNKKILLGSVFVIIVLGCIFCFFKLVNIKEKEEFNIVNKEENKNIEITNEVNESGIPYLYIEYNNTKIKGTIHDYSYYFEDEKFYNLMSDEFMEIWTLDETQDIITINCEDIYDMVFYASNNSVFSIESCVNLQYNDNYKGAIWSKTHKIGLIEDKEKGNRITVGVSSSNPNYKVVKIYKIHYDNIGDVYYAFRFNCVEE